MTSDSTIKPLRLHRRQVVQGAAALTGGVAAGAMASSAGFAAPSSQQRWMAWLNQTGGGTPVSVDEHNPEALSTSELDVVRAITARIFPTDDLGPGAIEAGVFIYIDRLLAGRGGAMLPAYQDGLAALNAAAEGGDFIALDDAAQDDLLRSLEAEEVANAPAGFFGLVLEHTRQGMFGDPIHGGNREFIGWDLIRYPGVKLVWTAEDQAINSDVEPEHISVEQYGGTAS